MRRAEKRKQVDPVPCPLFNRKENRKQILRNNKFNVLGPKHQISHYERQVLISLAQVQICLPKFFAIFIVAKHQHFARNLLKVITYCDVPFCTLVTIISVYFHHFLQGFLSNRNLHKNGK